MASSAGQRKTNPPERLIDQVLQGGLNKNIPIMPNEELESSLVDPPKEATLADVMSMMKQFQEEARKSQNIRFDRLDDQFKSVQNNLNQHDGRISKVEKNVATLYKNQVEHQATVKNYQEKVSSVSTEVETLKEAVKLLQINATTSFNPGLSSTSIPAATLPSTLVPPPTSMPPNLIQGRTMYDSIRPSFLSSTERMNDVVSEFSGIIKDVHPERFLNELANYFENSYFTDVQKLNAVQRRLKNDAYMWYDSLIPSPRSYEEFVGCFRQQFWSIDIQRRVYDDVFRPYQYRSPTGLATHAIMWITKAKYLDPPIHQLSLVSTIIQHYPSTLAIAVRGRGPKTTGELISVLTEFENTVSFWDQPQPEQYQNHGRQNVPHHNNPRPNNHQFSNQSRGNGNVQHNRGRYPNNNRRFDDSRNNHQRQSPPSPQQPRVNQLDVSENENGSLQ